MKRRHPWRVVSGSARGDAHERSGLPNQDALAVHDIAAGSAVVIAVADGHGSRRSFRSDVGAALAVEIGSDEADIALTRLNGSADSAALEVVGDGLATSIIERWQARVLEHLELEPLREGELDGTDSALAEHERDPLRAYGSTLVLAVLTESAIVLIQIGDGDIVLRTSAGVVLEPIPREPSLVNWETRSLCLSDARKYTSVVVVDRATLDVDLVLMATDGYGNAFEDPRWQSGVANDFAAHIEQHGVEWIDARLIEWLADSARVAGDDVTVAVASARPTVTVRKKPTPKKKSTAAKRKSK